MWRQNAAVLISCVRHASAEARDVAYSHIQTAFYGVLMARWLSYKLIYYTTCRRYWKEKVACMFWLSSNPWAHQVRAAIALGLCYVKFQCLFGNSAGVY
jgi:hypothetical protein